MTEKNSSPQTAAEVAEALSHLREKRGYLLPHHGLLAISSPDLMTAYDATYTHMTLTDRVLTLYEKEIIWLIVLVSTAEAIATHHIDRLRKSGGGETDLEVAVAVATWSEGAENYHFVEKNWGPHLSGFDAVEKYRAGLNRLTAGYDIDQKIFEIGLAAAHQCHRRWDWVGEHIKGAYQAGADEGAIAEGLALAMFPGGVPNFVDSCDIWRKLILNGEVEASPAYQAWANLTGQGGFDEASGKTG